MKAAAMIGLVCFLLASVAIGAVPGQMNVQGRLMDAGTPLSGAHPVAFKLYDAATGGGLLWAESSSLDVVNGLFTATLGATNPIPGIAFDDQPRWLEVTVDGATLSPRLMLTTSAYAFRAQRADTAAYALGSASAGDGLWSTDGTSVYRASGKVGIRTSAPDQDLRLDGMLGIGPTTWQQPTTQGLFLYHAGAGGGNLYAYDYPSGQGDPIGMAGSKVVLGTYNSSGAYDGPKVTVLGNGNVGIGTEAPNTKLHVAGGITADGVSGLSFSSLGTGLGNGSVYSLLDDTHLEFHGTYGYAVGDEYIDFQAGYSPGQGGQGSMARITANRDPAGYDLGHGRLKLSVRSGAALADILVAEPSGITVNGGLSVSGTKCRVVTTEFGRLKLNAVESAHALFMDDEPSAHLVNGRCRVSLSPKFLQTVTVNGRFPLAVNVTFYGRHGGEWYVERDAAGFTVVDPSGSNAEFSWQVVARQRDYEDANLDTVEAVAAVK